MSTLLEQQFKNITISSIEKLISAPTILDILELYLSSYFMNRYFIDLWWDR